MIHTLSPIAAFACAAAISIVCFFAGLLRRSGAVAAALIGGAIFGFAGWPGASALLAFFVTSNLVGRWRRKRKAALGFEKGGRRDAGQVVANGGAAAVLAVAGFLLPSHRTAIDIAFLAALAEANADTWATEIGSAVGAAAYLVTTLRRAPQGMSGAVSVPGTAAAVCGSAFIAAASNLLLPPASAGRGFVIVAISGLFGALVDSVLGATVQAQFLSSDGADRRPGLTERRTAGAQPVRGVAQIDNDVVNLLATIAAAALAFVLAHPV